MSSSNNLRFGPDGILKEGWTRKDASSRERASVSLTDRGPGSIGVSRQAAPWGDHGPWGTVAELSSQDARREDQWGYFGGGSAERVKPCRPVEVPMGVTWRHWSGRRVSRPVPC